MKSLTADELYRWKEEKKTFQLIDIREAYEVETVSLGGQHIPMDEILTRTGELRKDIPVVLHCNSGKRSDAVVYALEHKFGFTNLYSLEGGILSWIEKNDSGVKRN